ncbi:MAG: DUF2202 domain-containing protein [Methanotrichaceae archaeon]|nr:DUF2202 domain-containing protein [Methanotrichaceae archaeon]
MVIVMRPLSLIALIAAAILCGCIQTESPPEASEHDASEEWNADGVVGDHEYARSLVLHGAQGYGLTGGDLEISWKNDDEYIYLAMRGETTGWTSLGFDPREWMKDADMILGYVVDDEAFVKDQYSVDSYGPHPEDVELGGTDDIAAYGGREVDGYTVIEVKRRLNTGDTYDKAFTPGEEVPIIWAMSSSDDPLVKHNVAHGEAVIVLDSGGSEVREASPLTAQEVEGVTYIREEEKMARDLYREFGSIHNLSIMNATANSEQNHMDAVKVLIDRNGIADPVVEARGAFTASSFQEIYENYSATGQASPEEALRIACSIEEMSITDLSSRLNETDSEEIRVTYVGLLEGSKKHLRSFVGVLNERGESYSPAHLSQAEFDEIVR